MFEFLKKIFKTEGKIDRILSKLDSSKPLKIYVDGIYQDVQDLGGSWTMTRGYEVGLEVITEELCNDCSKVVPTDKRLILKKFRPIFQDSNTDMTWGEQCHYKDIALEYAVYVSDYLDKKGITHLVSDGITKCAQEFKEIYRKSNEPKCSHPNSSLS